MQINKDQETSDVTIKLLDPELGISGVDIKLDVLEETTEITKAPKKKKSARAKIHKEVYKLNEQHTSPYEQLDSAKHPEDASILMEDNILYDDYDINEEVDFQLDFNDLIEIIKDTDA